MIFNGFSHMSQVDSLQPALHPTPPDLLGLSRLDLQTEGTGLLAAQPKHSAASVEIIAMLALQV
jgi:hypothetical protein